MKKNQKAKGKNQKAKIFILHSAFRIPHSSPWFS
jgi:hypothetical protein